MAALEDWRVAAVLLRGRDEHAGRAEPRPAQRGKHASAIGRRLAAGSRARKCARSALSRYGRTCKLRPAPRMCGSPVCPATACSACPASVKARYSSRQSRRRPGRRRRRCAPGEIRDSEHPGGESRLRISTGIVAVALPKRCDPSSAAPSLCAQPFRSGCPQRHRIASGGFCDPTRRTSQTPVGSLDLVGTRALGAG